jgi:hypothetical protein
MKKKCLVCGTKISLMLKKNIYLGGHYFGEFKLPIKPGEYKKVKTAKFGKTKFDVVKWIGKEKENYSNLKIFHQNFQFGE